MMDAVGNRAAVKDTDVRSNHTTTETIGNQVAVLHTGAPGNPCIALDQTIVVNLLKATINTMAGHFDNSGRVCGKDHVNPETEVFGIEVERRGQISALKPNVDCYDSTA